MKEKVILIHSRFALLNGPDRIEVYDIRNPKRASDGSVRPIAVIPLEAPIDDRDAGKRALAWLRRAEYLTLSEHLHYADIFLAQHKVLNGRKAVLQYPYFRENKTGR